MSNGPSVTATIAVDDKASPALKELANLAKMIAKETAAALNGSNGNGLANSYNKATVAANQANVVAQAANVQHLVQLTAFSKVYAPFAGTITARTIDRGALVSDTGTTPMFTKSPKPFAFSF